MHEPLLQTPLYGKHVELGGRMVPFAGYAMPVQYTGIIAESRAVRESAGMFDVSHMARLTLHGPNTFEFLERVTSNDVSKLVDKQGQYSLLPNIQGGCVDDVIIYRMAEDRFQMVVNASNHSKDVAWLKSQNSGHVEIGDYTDSSTMIAVQGPSAGNIVAGLSDAPEAIRAAGPFGVVECKIAGVDCFAARSGYTGEDGFEVICGADGAVALWDTLLLAGVTACGLGARDTLRVEAGLPLYGHELSDSMSPISAGLGWVVSKTKVFIGSGPISEARAHGTPTKLVGVRLETKRLITPGMKVVTDGNEIGVVSSGVVSPLLDCGIAFAFIDASVALESPCQIEVRGKLEPGAIVNKRFFKRPK